MTTCRSTAEAFAAGQADAADDPPLSQDQADLVAVILAPCLNGTRGRLIEEGLAMAQAAERGGQTPQPRCCNMASLICHEASLHRTHRDQRQDGREADHQTRADPR